MKTLCKRYCVVLMLACVCSVGWGDDLDSGIFLLHFDSKVTSDFDSGFVNTRVVANYLLDPVEGERGRFRGLGRLRYTELSGVLGSATDGVLAVNDMQVSLAGTTLSSCVIR